MLKIIIFFLFKTPLMFREDNDIMFMILNKYIVFINAIKPL